MGKTRGYIILCCAAAAALVIAVWPVQTTQSFSDAILKVGSRHEDVFELQGRLQYLGFYHGQIDGIFGWQTYWAVRNFQYEFGLKVDGIVGIRTKTMLWKATKNWTPGMTAGGTGGTGGTAGRVYPASSGFSWQDIKLMAHVVHGEARGEPYAGQVAVAAVILNRLESELFPDTVAGVVYQPGAFTAVADGQINLAPNETAYKAVRDAINGWDPSGGALYYFNPATATSAWIWNRPQITRIGKHIFCK